MSDREQRTDWEHERCFDGSGHTAGHCIQREDPRRALTLNSRPRLRHLPFHSGGAERTAAWAWNAGTRTFKQGSRKRHERREQSKSTSHPITLYSVHSRKAASGRFARIEKGDRGPARRLPIPAAARLLQLRCCGSSDCTANPAPVLIVLQSVWTCSCPTFLRQRQTGRSKTPSRPRRWAKSSPVCCWQQREHSARRWPTFL